jgi:predicted O-linked N-acetylglucosamine transferase (SPINDLY family)
MVDHSAFNFTESHDQESLNYVLKDDICRHVYSDLVTMYQVTPSFKEEEELLRIVTKYNQHYLALYFAGVHYNKINRLDQAIMYYQQCISQYPLADAYLNLAIIYYTHNHIQDARALLLKANNLYPNEGRILNFLGTIFYSEKDYIRTIDFYNKIINDAAVSTVYKKQIYNNIGFSYSAIGKCRQACQCFEQGLSLPNTGDLNLQLLQNKLINYDYMLDLPMDTYSQFLRINDILQVSSNNYGVNRDVRSHNMIRIGYVSPDLRQHVCAYFMEAILAFFDRDRFQVYCYANIRNEDKVSQRFKQMKDIRWFNIFNQSTNDVCCLIQQHQIDILVDLAGHTNGNRLDVFAKKPAPIQVTYLGYPNTTGLINMDYRITDCYADPLTTRQKYSERLVYLPKCFICYTPSVALDLLPLRPYPHLSYHNTHDINRYITFGVMNKINKHNKETFRAWGEILKQVPHSRLFIKNDVKCVLQKKMKYFTKIGLDEHRVVIFDKIPSEIEYLQLYNQIDICLDTFPYSGTTTSCDSFLMSTPIVTYGIPDRHVSNVTASILINMGHPELVTHTFEEYIKVSIELAKDANRIDQYKSSIRGQFMELMNGKIFTDDFDHLMDSIYKTTNDF